MRRKLGILMLVGVTILAGTREAAVQFKGLRSSLTDLTRASLWSGLIVYAQPVADGTLPTPQIYYLMPQPSQAAPAAQEAILADNDNNVRHSDYVPAVTASKPVDAKNNHVAEEEVGLNAELATAAREIEDAAKSELALDKLPRNLTAANPVAPKPEKTRVYEEVAKHEPLRTARRLKHEADVIAKVFVKEFDAAKLEAETARLILAQEQIETLKLKSLDAAEGLHRRMELRVLRRGAPRPERMDRIRVINSFAETRTGAALPDMSSIGCEKTPTAPPVADPAPVEATDPAPVVAPAPAVALVGLTSVQVSGEPLVELALPAAPAATTTGTSWALGCDTEPEEKQ